jgi:cytochrome c oxidase assembly factor CtaG
MTTMTIIVMMVVVPTLVILGVLVGMSVHREATRRRRQRLHRQELDLALEWSALMEERRTSDHASA